MPPKILIPLSFGDVREVAFSIWLAAKTRDWSVVRRELWLLREHHRRGTWRPFTFGDYLTLRRRRTWLATPPDVRGERPRWRHGGKDAQP